VAIYRLHDTAGDDLGLLEHPAPNLEPGDVVVVSDRREAIVTVPLKLSRDGVNWWLTSDA